MDKLFLSFLRKTTMKDHAVSVIIVDAPIQNVKLVLIYTGRVFKMF